MTEHLEDEVLNGGVGGTRGAINFLQSLRDMLAGHSSEHKINLTTKWDGAPAIFAGINPANGKFFVGTKGVFAQNAKLNYTNADIDKNHPGEGLNVKLKIALKYSSPPSSLILLFEKFVCNPEPFHSPCVIGFGCNSI